MTTLNKVCVMSYSRFLRIRRLPFSIVFLSAAVLVGLADAQNNPRGLIPEQTRTDQRLALVIGNQAYEVGALTNSRKDAEDMAATLKRFHFAVTLGIDLRQQTMEQKINDFLSKVSEGATVVFYYAGHGMQIQDQNYLLPTDFHAASAMEAKYHSYPVDQLLDRLQEKGVGLQIIILDACRDNPFKTARSAGGGLAAMTSGVGTYIAFATAPGRTAADNPSDQNGLFTGELLTQLSRGQGTLDQIFNQVRAQVQQRSGGAQTPWSISSVVGDFYFNPPAPSIKQSPEEVARAQWDMINGSNNRDLLTEYILTSSRSAYVVEAKKQIDDLDWNAANHSNDRVKLLFYIGQHRDGAYVQQVRGQLEELDWNDAHNHNDRDSLVRFLNQYPASQFAAQARDELEQMDWRMADHSGNAPQLEAYLIAHPSGRDADAAKTQLMALEGHPVTAGSDSDNIRETLNLYAHAFQDKDIVGLRHVWPTITDKEFKNMRNTMNAADSIAITIEPSSAPAVNGNAAHVACVQTARFTMNGNVQVVRNDVDVRMQKLNDGQWIIESAQYSKTH